MPLVYIGMGGNVASRAGRPEATLTEAAKRLARLGRLTRRSRLYSTAPVGIARQPRFVNAVVELETDLQPLQLLEALLQIEREFGRDRPSEVRNGPRTLDLDILFYGDKIVHEPDLDVPHSRIAVRAFALVPLSEIAPSLHHPVNRRTVQELVQTLANGNKSGDDAPIPIPWNDWHAGPFPVDDAGLRPILVSDSDRPESDRRR